MVLLSPMELDTTMRMILQVPIWAQRVIYIQGSCLKDGDLSRARMSDAKACFVLAARNYADKAAAVILLFSLKILKITIKLTLNVNIGRTHNIAFMGRQGLRPNCSSVRTNFSTRKQIAREICRVCCLRRRAQVCSARKQLHLSRSFDFSYSFTTHE